MGTIVSITAGEALRVGVQFDFCERAVYYSANSIARGDLLDLAYALTVHRSQGSEYDHVIVPLAPEYGALRGRDFLEVDGDAYP